MSDAAQKVETGAAPEVINAPQQALQTQIDQIAREQHREP